MTARGIGVFTIEFPDPNLIDYNNREFVTLNDSISFQYRGVTNIQTLSTKDANGGSDPFGILYVPDLSTDACKRNESQYVPANATRLANLPSDRDYAFIAFAPWYSPQCMMEYFTTARRQGTTGAFITYLPGDSNAQPPVLNNPAWDLHDGGVWQSENTFPTYALSSISGNNIMDQLNLYSGNLSTVPNGDDLGRIYNSTNYVRLWATVATNSGDNLPSLWVFLVIVLGILIFAIAITSLCMHMIQRRRRNALRQRVLNGEVDLEVLGVKRLIVPQETLDKLPIVTYTAPPDDVEKPPAAASNLAPGLDAETGSKASPLVRRLSAPTPSTTNNVTFSQPTCPICIDDFEPNETQVRELPCRHIFHPDCIDAFLLNNSSLCPMCKQTVLPAGLCPVTITNAMVRRERHISRMRARTDYAAAHGGVAPPIAVTLGDHARRVPNAFGSLGRAVTGRRIFSAPERTQSRPADIEMGTPAPSPAAAAATPPQPIPNPPAQSNPQDCDPSTSPPPSNTTPHNRREWARQRALTLLGHPHASTQFAAQEEEQEAALPRWRRAVRKVFPGFG